LVLINKKEIKMWITKELTVKVFNATSHGSLRFPEMFKNQINNK
jgi:hypothetical protein